MKKRLWIVRWSWYLVIMAVFALCDPAFSAPVIHYQFEAEIDFFSGDSYGDFWEVGHPITGSFYYELGTYDYNSRSDMFQSSSSYGTFGYQYHYKDKTFTAPYAAAVLTNDMTHNKDRFDIGDIDTGHYTQTTFDFGDVRLSATIRLIDDTLTAFDNANTLPVGPMDLSQFTRTSISIIGYGDQGILFNTSAHLTDLTLIPEPATVALLGLGAFVLRVRKSR